MYQERGRMVVPARRQLRVYNCCYGTIDIRGTSRQWCRRNSVRPRCLEEVLRRRRLGRCRYRHSLKYLLGAGNILGSDDITRHSVRISRDTCTLFVLSSRAPPGNGCNRMTNRDRDHRITRTSRSRSAFDAPLRPCAPSALSPRPYSPR